MVISSLLPPLVSFGDALPTWQMAYHRFTSSSSPTTNGYLAGVCVFQMHPATPTRLLRSLCFSDFSADHWINERTHPQVSPATGSSAISRIWLTGPASRLALPASDIHKPLLQLITDRQQAADAFHNPTPPASSHRRFSSSHTAHYKFSILSRRRPSSFFLVNNTCTWA